MAHDDLGEEARLKIVWNHEGKDFDPYRIPTGILKDRADDVRLALQCLIEKGMKNSNPVGRYGVEMKRLAEAGNVLYQALFDSIDDEEDVFNAFVAKKWLTEREAAPGKRIQISFIVGSSIHVPWGLIYDGPVEGLSGDPEHDAIEHYQEFWCIKFLLTSVYNQLLPKVTGVSDASGLTDILSVLNRKTFQDASPRLVPPQDDILTWIENSFGQAVESSEEFFRAWQSRGERCRLLYFYCHAGSQHLELGLDDWIRLSDFRQKTRILGSSQRATCLVFLNGCNTAEGHVEHGFMNATGEFLFCGFVGTETKIPDVFALRFGLAFLYYFLHDGLPIFETMDVLRRKHWPIALTYSAYCQPLLSFGAAMKSLDVELTENFSQMHLGTSQM